MKSYQKIEIAECNEALVAIPHTEFKLEIPSAYVSYGADYQGKSPYFLRQSVLDKLRQAKVKLKKIKPHWRLKIFDGYRPISVQQHMVDYTFQSICSDRRLNPQQLNSEEKEELYQEVYQIWAIPSDNPLTPPPHSTGSAIDLTLMTDQGEEIDMGGEIDELSPRSHPDYYAQAVDQQGQIYHAHRNILLQIMSNAGFRRHPHEWWHFSYGDQLWAWLETKANPQVNAIARYGRVTY